MRYPIGRVLGKEGFLHRGDILKMALVSRTEAGTKLVSRRPVKEVT
jgi:hypothetical protein